MNYWFRVNRPEFVLLVAGTVGGADLVRRIIHPDATIVYDTTKPDGTPRKLLDISRLHALGWRHRTSLGEGIESTYGWFLANHADARGVVTS